MNEYFINRIVEQNGLTKELRTLYINDTSIDDGIERNIEWCYSGEHGINIIPFNLKKETYSIKNPNSDKEYYNQRRWEYIRFTPEKEKEKGKKCMMPKGEIPPCFIPPNIIDRFDNGLKIKNLVITEGYIKAIRAYVCEEYCIGLPSITTIKNKNEFIYSDIIDIIIKCKVDNVYILWDADFYMIRERLSDERPRQFLNSALAIRDGIKKECDCNIYFSAIAKESTKGLDDLLIFDNTALNKLFDNSMSNEYFAKALITKNDTKLYTLIGLNDVFSFYEKHKIKLGLNIFTYAGKEYKYNDIHNKVIRYFKPEQINVFRVGDDFFKIIELHDKSKIKKTKLVSCKRVTIVDDYGKDFLKDIKKFDSFVNIPAHNEDYQQFIGNCYNMYHKIDIKPIYGSWDNIRSLILHVFGSQYEMGLDYIQILYQNPIQKLPILCLVAKENHTGKTTFANFLCDIFLGNAVIIGNDELCSQFNSIYASKLLTIIDESKIDKNNVLEKLKSMSTSETINIRYLYVNPHTIDFFGKFILISNHEDNFINAREQDIRYWIRRVPVFTGEFNPNYSEVLKSEIPAFINFLNTRQLSTKKKSRMWFDAQDINTIELEIIKECSRPTLYKEIKEYIGEFFSSNDMEICYASVSDIKNRFFANNSHYDLTYLRKILKTEFNSDPSTVKKYYPFNGQEQKTGRVYTFKRIDYVEQTEIDNTEVEYERMLPF